MSEQAPTTPDPIDGILHALRTAESSPEMQQRVAAALRRADIESSQNPAFRLPEWCAALLKPGVAAAGLCAVLVATVAVFHAYSRGLQVKDVATVTPVQRAARSPGLQPPSGAPHHDASVSRTTRDGAISRGKESRVPRGLPLLRETALQQPAATNIPEPPEPLTHQERLLVQLVRRNTPVELASMTHAAREAELQKEKDEVSLFFTPPQQPSLEGQP